jgi:hypothetical protein
MMIGAIMYVASAGNPSRMGDAKDRIMSAILGIIILLASFLILRTISPDLVNFKISLPGIRPIGQGGSGPGRACLCWLTMNRGYNLQGCYPTQSACENDCNTFCINSGYVRGSCNTDNTCD